MTLKFNGRSWKTIGHLFYVASSFVHHFIAICEFKLELQSGNAQFKLGQNRPFFFCRVTLKFDGWPWKQLGTSPKQHKALCIISSSYVNSIWSYSPETGYDLCDLDLWPMTLTFCMNITSVICNNSWQFRDDAMMGTKSKRCDGQTDRQTDRQRDRQTDRKYHSKSCLVAAKNESIMHQNCGIMVNCKLRLHKHSNFAVFYYLNIGFRLTL